MTRKVALSNSTTSSASNICSFKPHSHCRHHHCHHHHSRTRAQSQSAERGGRHFERGYGCEERYAAELFEVRLESLHVGNQRVHDLRPRLHALSSPPIARETYRYRYRYRFDRRSEKRDRKEEGVRAHLVEGLVPDGGTEAGDLQRETDLPKLRLARFEYL